LLVWTTHDFCVGPLALLQRPKSGLPKNPRKDPIKLFTSGKIFPRANTLLASANGKTVLALATGLSLVVAGFAVVPRASDANDPPAPTFTITDFTEAETPSSIAKTLAGTGVEFTNVKINGKDGSAEQLVSSSEKSIFGTFANGLDAIGIDSGLVIGANDRASFFGGGGSGLGGARPNIGNISDPNVGGTQSIGQALLDLAKTSITRDVNSVWNLTTLEFTVVPTDDFLKFEYVLAITEFGGAEISFPDGVGLFYKNSGVASWTKQNNCAVVPTTTSYVAMETAGISATKAEAELNLQSLIEGVPTTSYASRRVVVPETPPVVPAPALAPNEINPPGIAFPKNLGPVRFMTLPITCVINVSSQKGATPPTPVEIAIAVSDFNDGIASPAVFLQGSSFRFSSSQVPVSASLETPSDNTQQQSGPSIPAPSRALEARPAAIQSVLPGSSAVLLDDGGVEHTRTSEVKAGLLTIAGDGWSASIGASRPAGKSASVSAPNGDLRVPLSGALSFNLSGYEPASQVMVYAMPSGKVVASLTVNKKGLVDYKNVKLPKNLSLSNKFLQINGLSEAGLVRSITINAAMFKRAKVVVEQSEVFDRNAKASIRKILADAKGEAVVRCVAYADMSSEEDVAAKRLKAQEFCDYVTKQDPTLVTKVVVREPFKKRMNNRVALRLRG
jgi:hypothetical protein